MTRNAADVRDARLRAIAAAALVVGAVLGLAGSFASSPAWRSLAWGADGTALVVGSALLAVHHLRRGHELAAAGFLVYLAGQTLVAACSAMPLGASTPVFGAGVGLWAAALVLVGASDAMPGLVRGIGFVAALLFAVVAARIFTGDGLTPLSEPLPFFAYPFLVATLLGWAWAHWKAR